MALLREVFGPGVEKVKLEHRGFKTPTGRAVELTTIASHFHVEINPGDAGSKSLIAAVFVARFLKLSSMRSLRSLRGSRNQ